ncbi:hypothetical protein [Micromonospora sonneratiae]|uniref:Glyoxalase-like domain-containing protein n=1 Tax=Micromonospora sonneratiae TaxID=1184706 RepID=A0ABW3YF90_9ACTN
MSDVTAAVAEYAAATGNQFGTVKMTKTSIKLEDGRTRHVVLRHAVSLRGGPHVELVQASPPIGPWAVAPTSSVLSYTVPDLARTPKSTKLARAGFRKIASNEDVSFWRGIGGLTIRLIESDAVARPGAAGPAPAASDLGPIMSLTLSPCAPDAFVATLSTLLGVAWDMRVFPMPYVFADGTSQVLDIIAYTSVSGPLYLAVETPHHAPLLPRYACSDRVTPIHYGYPTLDVASVERQFVAGGMSLVGRVPGMVGYYETPSGILIEAFNASLAG